MYDVHHEQHGNFIAIGFEVRLLYTAHLFGAAEIQRGADPRKVVIGNAYVLFRSGCRRFIGGIEKYAGKLRKLLQFFVKRHFFKQFFDGNVLRFFFVFHGISSPDIPVVFCTESYERL